jgi:hypothetical protein
MLAAARWACVIVAAALVIASAATVAAEVDVPPAPLTLPALEPYLQPNAVLIPGRLFPIGWSRNGRFAYVYEPPDEACGCYRFFLIVQDLATNHVVWDYRYESDPESIVSERRISSLSAMWRAHGKWFTAQLTSLGISRIAEARLESSARVVIERRGVGDRRESYAVRVSPQSSGQRAFESGQIGPGLLDVSSPGFIASPYGQYIAVVIEELWRGWEGPPHTARLRVIGLPRPAAAR